MGQDRSSSGLAICESKTFFGLGPTRSIDLADHNLVAATWTVVGKASCSTASTQCNDVLSDHDPKANLRKIDGCHNHRHSNQPLAVCVCGKEENYQKRKKRKDEMRLGQGKGV